MRVKVDLARCTGIANCVVQAPRVFALGDDDDQVQVLVHDVPEADQTAVQSAVRMCPQGALTVE